LAFACVLLALASATHAAPLANGDSVLGVISIPGEAHTWEFSATDGDLVMLRVAETTDPGVYPVIELAYAGGGSIETARANTVATIEYPVTTTGDYTVTVSDFFPTGTGPYELHLARIPGANEYGLLANDSRNAGSIRVGDLDTHTLTATDGDHISLRMANINSSVPFGPRVELYDPSGVRVAQHSGITIATVQWPAEATGTYTVLLRDDRFSGINDYGAGAYELFVARVPGGNEHGALDDDANHDEEIILGDLDTFTFTGNSDQHVTLRIADLYAADLTPRIELYDPSGAQLDFSTGDDVATIECDLDATGTFSVLVRDDSISGGDAIASQTALRAPSGGA
jgi:hypothetical protein